MNIVITGANRGIGLGFVESYLSQGHHVWACCRKPEQADALRGIDSSLLHLVRWEVTTEHAPETISGAALPASIHLLINNAGVYGPGKDGQSLDNITADSMHDVFEVNAVAPLRVVQFLLPALKKGRAKVANISSKMGSISDNSSGGTYAYRASKTALLMISKSMAVDLEPFGVHVFSLHPGWVKTDMTNQTGLIDVNGSVAGMIQVIEEAHSIQAGSFISFDGSVVPF